MASNVNLYYRHLHVQSHMSLANKKLKTAKIRKIARRLSVSLLSIPRMRSCYLRDCCKNPQNCCTMYQTTGPDKLSSLRIKHMTTSHSSLHKHIILVNAEHYGRAGANPRVLVNAEHYANPRVWE